MARIMCSRALSRRLGYARSGEIHEPIVHGASLGSWAAKIFRCDGRELVLGLNARTYLTVVFELPPPADFRRAFQQALAWILEDLRVNEESLRQEVVAIDFAPFTVLTDRSVAESLNRVQYFCELELTYHEDLRRVQLNLNDLPHPHQDPCVPCEAVRALFA